MDNPAQNQVATINSSNLPGWLSGINGSLSDAQQVAAMLSKSEMVPKAYQNKPNEILIAGAMGNRLGLDLFSALAGIAVVNGRATLYGDAMLAVCQASPDFQDIDEGVTGENDLMIGHSTVTRRGRTPYTSTFSVADAKKAGLWAKAGPWTQNPKRMLVMRARGFTLRGVFADRLSGFLTHEEAEDIREVEATVHPTIPEAQPAKARMGRPPKDAARVKEAVAEATEEQKAAEETPIVRVEPEKAPAKPETSGPTPGDLFDVPVKPEAQTFKVATVDDLKAKSQALYNGDSVTRNHMLAVFSAFGVKKLQADVEPWTPEKRGQMLTALHADAATWKAAS